MAPENSWLYKLEHTPSCCSHNLPFSPIILTNYTAFFTLSPHQPLPSNPNTSTPRLNQNRLVDSFPSLRMPSIVRTISPHSSYESHPKSRFKTVLGFSTVSRISSDTDTRATRAEFHDPAFARQSIDTARSYSTRRKKRADRGSVANISFFQPDNATDGNHTPVVDLTLDLDNNMTIDNTLSNPSGMRPPVRMDAQDGPWSISVAETPHDAHSYSLYIKSEPITFHPTRSSFFLQSSWHLRPCCPPMLHHSSYF